MKAETLRQWIEANPFNPFAVNLADGRGRHVPDRDFISISPSARMRTIWDRNDTCGLFDLMLVIGFHVKGRRNGPTQPSK